MTGVNTSRFATMSAAPTVCPATTGVPLLASTPATGSVPMRTPRSALAGLSEGSLKPKSATLKV